MKEVKKVVGAQRPSDVGLYGSDQAPCLIVSSELLRLLGGPHSSSGDQLEKFTSSVLLLRQRNVVFKHVHQITLKKFFFCTVAIETAGPCSATGHTGSLPHIPARDYGA